MIKKITALSLVIAIMLSMTVFASFNDVDSDSEYANAIQRLVQYGILSGKGDGNFDPDAGLTRSEMAKIATIISGYKNEASANAGISLYSDLEDNYWASGYINVASKYALVLGYPNGTYEPEKSLTFAEAVTVVLRVLSYLSSDLGNNWPEAYTAKAAELLLTQGMNYGDYDLISRKDMALILDRALLTDCRSLIGTAIKAIQLMDYTITDEIIILATNAENKNLLSDEVSTTLGTYKKLDDSVDEYVTRKVKLVLNDENKIVNVMPIKQSGKDIIIQSVIGTEIAYTEKEQSSSLKMDDNSIVYYQGNKKYFSDIKSLMETGMTMAVYYSANGGYDYAVIKDFEMIGPIVVTNKPSENEISIGGYELNTNGLRVIRDGFESKLSDIQIYDVVYYNKASNILSAYIDKVSGVYEEAYPSKSNVTKITLSGVEYELETQDALKALGEYPGAYKIKDYMTLLFGKDKKIAGVISMNSTDITKFGIILSCEEKISEIEDNKGTTENYINLFTVNGVQQQFKTDKDYSDYRGRLIEYEFSNGIFIPKFLNYRKITGKVDTAKRAIGDNWLSKDTKIIDVSYIPAENENAPAVAKLIDFSEITVKSISESNVIHTLTDSKFGDIQFLVLNNITASKYKFGIITEKKGSGPSANYTVIINGTEKSFSSNNLFGPGEDTPIMVSLQDNSLTEIKPLSELSTRGKFVAADIQRIKIGNNSYPLASDVVAYMYKNFKYSSISLNDLSSHDMVSLRIFSDKVIANGGLVRIILFSE